ncbi:hypothetical protein Ancab_035181 [Ancistrocladus abbreviatus]
MPGATQKRPRTKPKPKHRLQPKTDNKHKAGQQPASDTAPKASHPTATRAAETQEEKKPPTKQWFGEDHEQTKREAPRPTSYPNRFRKGTPATPQQKPHPRQTPTSMVGLGRISVEYILGTQPPASSPNPMLESQLQCRQSIAPP